MMPALDIDRVAPSHRPPARCVMRQQWRHLLFVHWPIPVEVLRPLVPNELSLDTYEGVAYVGLIPFTMCGVHPIWVPPMPGVSTFYETNVRTYVHFEGSEPGVWFFSLDASNPIAVGIARALWHLPYYWARMHVDCVEGSDQPIFSYYSARKRNPKAYTKIKAMPCSTPKPSPVGSLEHFLVERYVLYVKRGKRLYRGRIHHSPYPLQHAQLLYLEEGLVKAAGLLYADAMPLVHYAAGVDVEIFPFE